MHPIERLRWIALEREEATATLAAEAAWTLSELAAEDPAAVVTACRRLVESHGTAGPLWWVAATLLVAPDPQTAARRAVDELLSDPTADLLAEVLGERLGSGAVIVVACPAETVRDALSQASLSAVRIVGALPGRRAEQRRFAAVVREVSDWDLDEADDAVQGATLVLLEALAAGPAGVLVASGIGDLVSAARAASVPLWAVVGVGRVLHAQLLEEMLRRADGKLELIAPDSIQVVIGPSGPGTPVEGLGRQPCPRAPELMVRAS
ncbi:MAG: hypothetical protein ABSG36_08875 [Acidimicrobiales bacterium]|jgi:hypothetical protein